MIWHFAEVWLLLVMTFIVGCVLGAFLYGVLADSRFAVAQGIVADGVGDVLDRVKVRFGLGPAWRAKQMRGVVRPAPPVTREPAAREEPEERQEVEAPPQFEEAQRIPLPPPVPREEPPPVQRQAAAPRPAEPLRPPQPRQGPGPRLPVEAAVTPGDPLRVASAMQVGPDGIVPKRPAGLVAARGGVPDNLTRIKGIGQRNEELLNSLGIFHFGQIAAWTPAEARWIGQYLAFPERIERDGWIAQATILASGVDTGFEKSAERRRRRRRELQQERLAEQAGAIATAAESAPAAKPADDFAGQVRAARPRPPADDWQVDDAAADVAGEEDDEDTATSADEAEAGAQPGEPPAPEDEPERRR